ncbi:hypothetical protein AADEFJLK_04493 [Methylovulum psychrotolerans]|uniref:Uncharacterized protein n=1 Tax=Methylovulum psychrotolerans TaxID=1704499 RepID=A0A2S5CG01_9GAMM|nr:hypothetical protein AADEFJLK_04493 [Methylovulum psychrotolerans]
MPGDYVAYRVVKSLFLLVSRTETPCFQIAAKAALFLCRGQRPLCFNITAKPLCF